MWIFLLILEYIAFQIAVALAEYDAEEEEGKIILTDNHLRAVVELSRDFKHYMDDLHGKDEPKRAQMRKERLSLTSSTTME